MGRDHARGAHAANPPSRGAPPQQQQQPLRPPPPDYERWCADASYVMENAWDTRVPREVVRRFRPSPGACVGDGRSACVRPGRIRDPAHPACGEFGLFAAKRLAPGSHACDYRGRVTLAEHESKSSAYTLAFVEEPGLSLTLDAEAVGNEGRFVNDFRGVPGARRANVRFASRVDERGNTHMGVYVLPGVTLAKGDELLLSYGKGYWIARGLLRCCGVGGAEGAEAEVEVEEVSAAESNGAGGGRG